MQNASPVSHARMLPFHHPRRNSTLAPTHRQLALPLASELVSVIDELQAAGVQRDAALASLGVVRPFDAWAEHDAAAGGGSLDRVVWAVEHDEYPLKLVGYDGGNWASWRWDLSGRQRADAESVARDAIAAARRALASPAQQGDSSSSVPGGLSSLAGTAIGADGYLRAEAGSGRVIFGSGYNGVLSGFAQWELKKNGERLVNDALWPTLREQLGVNTLSCRLFPDKVSCAGCGVTRVPCTGLRTA